MNTNPQLKASARGGNPRANAANERQTRHPHYNKFLDQQHTPTEKERAALAWLARDFALLPVQPNSKKLVNKFGYYQNKITTAEKVFQWFGEKTFSNLAVCATQTSLILDFDDPDLYHYWAGKFPDAARTYTEQTPHGGYHVFGHIWKGDLKGFVPVKGVELKQVVVVYPSTIDGMQYTQGAGELLDLDATRILSPLSQPAPIAKAPRLKTYSTGGGKLAEIKAAFSCLDLVRSADSTSKIYGEGKRFITLRCPFHDDKEPSFWIDTTRNLWGCHACGVRGDVINLYARLNGLTVPEAIRKMRENL
jgi:hypothetical protein